MVNLALVLIVIGVLLWAVESYVPMSPPIRTILRAVVVTGVLLWALGQVGLLPAGVTAPRLG